MDPRGPVRFSVLRPLDDLFLRAWQIERRVEFPYRRQDDRWLRPPLLAPLRSLQDLLREDDRLTLEPDSGEVFPDDDRSRDAQRRPAAVVPRAASDG